MAHCILPPVKRAPGPDPTVRRRFHRSLLEWYGRHRRELPWRRTDDPYHILVSEIMLQQTQVDRVIPKYHEFLGRYPTLESLAAADTADVKRTWYPLGYNIRPVNLQGIARETLARYAGRLPDDPAALRSMRGIGRYTAGAILSFAYRRNAALVDTNVRRVLGRVFLGPRKIRRLRGDKVIWGLAEALVPPKRAYDYNQALMDFGATWCTARAPRCQPCPMNRFCASYDEPRGSEDGSPQDDARPVPLGNSARISRPRDGLRRRDLPAVRRSARSRDRPGGRS
jgi:A/G-specific adenine glycosylase